MTESDEKVLGQRIEENDIQSFSKTTTFEEIKNKNLYEIFKEIGSFDLVKLYLKTNDRKLVTYAMELCNNYKKEKLNDTNTYT